MAAGKKKSSAPRGARKRGRRIPPSVEKAKTTLMLLANATPNAAKKIIESANRDVIKAISEISLNTLNGVLKLTPSQRLKLKRYKNVMRKISQKKIKMADRRKIIQRGRSLLPLLLRFALPLVIKPLASKVLGSLTKKRRR